MSALTAWLLDIGEARNMWGAMLKHGGLRFGGTRDPWIECGMT